MRALFLAPYQLGRSPSQRFRFEQWLRLLPAGAIDAEVRPLFAEGVYDWIFESGRPLRKVLHTGTGLARRLGEALSAGRYDVVFVHRRSFPLGPPVLERLASHRTPLVYDFDDAIFLSDTSEANRAIAPLKRPASVAEIVGHATLTTVGNEWLASYARRFSPNVTVLPTTVDIEEYTPAPRPRSELVRIGWSGSLTTSRHLRTVADALRRMLKELPVELVVMGDPGYTLEGAPRVTALRWTPATEVDVLRSFDIGIMPLPDDDWSRGKCGLKALLYMAVGVPTVASPVGVNPDIISDGENGLLASTDEEWFDAIARLVEDEAFAKRLGAAGRETVEQRYSGQAWAPRFLEALERAADARSF